MQIDPKRFILAICLSATMACAGLTGCATEDRSAGTRLDDHLTAHHVREALAHAPVYKFNNVHVDVYDGIVQLSGFAETKEQKQYAGEIAGRVQGVRQLLNDIAVKPAELVSPTGYTYGRQYPPAPTPSNPQPGNYYNGQNNNGGQSAPTANRQNPPSQP